MAVNYLFAADNMNTTYTDIEFLAQRKLQDEDIKSRSDQWMNFLLVLYFIIGLILATYYGTWNIAILAGGTSLLAYYSVKAALPESDLYQYVLSAILGVFMAQFIYQMHGMAEMHFFAFIGSAILITYQKWKLQIPILIVVAVHHASFSYLQNIGYKEVYFTEGDGFDTQLFIIHMLLTIFIFFVCGLWAYQFKKNSERQIIQNIQLGRLQNESALNEERQRSQDEVEKYNIQLIKSNQELKLSREDAQNAQLEAQQANQAKSVFLATMSHEIRTPLNGMIGMSYLLAETSLMEQQRIYINSITSCSESLLSIINDIIDFSKIEAGSLDLEFKEFSVRSCLEEVMDMFSAKAAQGGIELTYEIDSEIPQQIIGDKTRLQQVLINLTGNALKFTQHGEVYMKVDLMGLYGDGDLEIKFAVHDTGIGIPDDKIDCLFKSFSQVDSAHNRKYGGTGLGLAISEKLVRLMNGNMHVESEPGKGSVFSFTMQAKQGRAVSPKQKEYNMINHAGKRILIVDDNQTNRIILKAQIENWHLEPIVTASGPEALEVLANGPLPDMLITDGQMPVMSGVELARIVKAKYQDIPIILLSSIGDDFNPETVNLFNCMLSKPVRQHQLGKHILNGLQEREPVTDKGVKKIKSTLSADFGQRFPMKILVAEDNKINMHLIVHLLKKLGYEPDMADNGLRAVEAVNRHGYDIILMDMQMPEMDGLEATRLIRENSGRQPVIIALTANALFGDRDECINAGMDDYMSKPIQIEVLVGLLEEWSPEGREKRKMA
jgi:two-component system sensor histidine kinase/response regulator